MKKFTLILSSLISLSLYSQNHDQSFDCYGWGIKNNQTILTSLGKYSESYIAEYDLSTGNYTYLNDSNDYRLNYFSVNGDTGVAVTGSSTVVYTHDNWETLNESTTLLSKVIATNNGFVGVRQISSTRNYYHSIDGNNWTQVTSAFVMPANSFTHKDGKTWIYGHPSQFQISYDGGVTFNNFTPSTYPTGEYFKDFITLDTTNIIAIANSAKWFLTTDGGDNWTHLANVPSSSTFIYAKDLDTLIASNFTGLHISLDTGNTWQPTSISFPGNNPTRAYNIGNHLVTFVPHFGQNSVYSNNQIGTPWYQLQKRHSQEDIFDVDFDGNIGIVVGENGEYAYTPDKGKTYYTGSNTLGTEDLIAAKVYGNTVLVANRQSDIYYSNDGGVNFTFVYNNTSNAVPDKFKASADLSTIVLFGDARNLISTDTGQTWNTVGILGGGFMDGTVTPSGKLLMLVGVFTTSSQVQIEEMNKSNGNRTTINLFTETDLQAVALEMVDNNRGYAIARNTNTQNLVFFSTTDGWATYTNLGTNLDMPNLRTALNVIGNDTLMVNFYNPSVLSSSDNRLFKSVDGGISWAIDTITPYKQGGSTDKMQKLHYFNANDFVSVWEDGRIYQSNFNSIVTSINEHTFLETTSLINAYPNPFVNKVNISSEDNILHASVYDVSGKLMLDTIENSKNIELNLQQLKAGIYFIRVQTENQLETIRVIKQ